MKHLSFILMSVLFLASCSSGDKEQLVTVDNKYTLSVPAFLTKAKDLHGDASLQYQNPVKEFYVVVLDETKEEMQKALDDNDLNNEYTNDINGYSDLLINGLGDEIKVERKSDITDTVINNMPARLLTIKGKTDNIDIYYSFAYIEGKSRYYQIMTWTLAEREDQFKEQMNRMIYSLKEL